ncbi:transcriptional regulator, IclR family [Halogranum rubrum]|uniref:Transcriptional regulator, IclR family n=1 Tax=Halogranum rubrum TaxID=553466 RepID=A0A1I4H2D3_9EURY|nr:IclR family transcriptional regulator [Halogranum rubrum]SFL35541.1 transcriptional regulator, IclR family [Halogranum rubrum]
MIPRRTENGLKTTEISLQLIELLVEQNGATLGDVVDETGLARSTVHNHLQTLSQYGYVVRENNSYRVGLKLHHLGDFARKQNEVYDIAKRIVTDLADETELEVDFTVEENGRTVSLYDVTNYTDTPSFLVDGRLFHMHSTASGKSILAEYPTARVEEILDQWGLPAETSKTITTRAELFDDLDRTRERGYALNDEEAIEGLWAVSKVVKDQLGRVCGSLNVCGPTYLRTDERERAVVDQLEQQVTRFEQEITNSG